MGVNTINPKKNKKWTRKSAHQRVNAERDEGDGFGREGFGTR